MPSWSKKVASKRTNQPKLVFLLPVMKKPNGQEFIAFKMHLQKVFSPVVYAMIYTPV
jgi:hypothetical protein